MSIAAPATLVFAMMCSVPAALVKSSPVNRARRGELIVAIDVEQTTVWLAATAESATAPNCCPAAWLITLVIRNRKSAPLADNAGTDTPKANPPLVPQAKLMIPSTTYAAPRAHEILKLGIFVNVAADTVVVSPSKIRIWVRALTEASAADTMLAALEAAFATLSAFDAAVLTTLAAWLAAFATLNAFEAAVLTMLIAFERMLTAWLSADTFCEMMEKALDVGDALPPVPAEMRFDSALRMDCIPRVETAPTDRTDSPAEMPLTRTLNTLTFCDRAEWA